MSMTWRAISAHPYLFRRLQRRRPRGPGRWCSPRHQGRQVTSYADRLGGSNGGGAGRGMVTIVELTDPRPYIFQPPVYGRLIYTVIYMSERLLTQANPNPRLPPPPDLRSMADTNSTSEPLWPLIRCAPRPRDKQCLPGSTARGDRRARRAGEPGPREAPLPSG